MQLSSHTYSGIVRDPIVIDWSSLRKLSLPEEYANVPAVSCKTDRLSVPHLAFDNEATGLLVAGRADEEKWFDHSLQLLTKESLMKDYYVSWAAFHASLESDPLYPPAITTLLPLFYEKAATISMVKHGMDVLQSITAHINPGQIPVMAFDQPLFALAKFVQWCWLDTHGEERYIVMFGGLHIEMALWNTLGDLLECSGWTTALYEADVASSGTADSFLKASHLTRTRYAHQVTALALEKLQREAWECMSFQQDLSLKVGRRRLVKVLLFISGISFFNLKF